MRRIEEVHLRLPHTSIRPHEGHISLSPLVQIAKILKTTEAIKYVSDAH
jgi:hypothetical protein